MAKRKSTAKPQPQPRSSPSAAAPVPQYQTPPIATADPPVQVPASYLYPPDKPLPDCVVKVPRTIQPCRKCRRVRCDDGGRAVVCTRSGATVAYFRCRVCGHHFSLPLETLGGAL